VILALITAHARAESSPGTAPATAPATQPVQQIFVLHLPGIGGLMRIDRLLTGGLTSGGIDAEVRIYDWTNGNPGMPALGGLQRNKQEAKNVAKLIQKRARENPDEKIIITCHSGGAGIAVWALESLPDDVDIDTLVMLAPALSPGYDLSGALKRVRFKAYSFNSEYDPILGPGTRAFGTIDRVMIDAAGRVGFEAPAGADERQYAKLVQFPYNRAWMSFGNIGDHIGPMMPRFASRVIAPLLLTGELPEFSSTQPTTASATQPTTAPSRRQR
jgi:hypothetical protein